jgi:ATP-binding cassette subfamily C protein CydD
VKPLDPRLLRRSGAARGTLVAGGAVALVQAAAIVAFAAGLAGLVAGLVDGTGLESLGGFAALLVVGVLVRSAAGWSWEWLGANGAARVKRRLRRDVLEAAGRTAGDAGASSARVATLLGVGLDALDDYFGRYLPQLVLTVVATPVMLVAVWSADPLSAIILVIVLPLLPVFMALIGMATKQVQERQWEGLQQLSHAFLEIVGGLSTLVVFNRAERQSARIRRTTDAYRGRTMKVLRMTFLSGFVLELGASLSIALVAVSIGLRLVSGELALGAGLFVLVLAPEVFLPLRNVGAAFHASTAGLEASNEAFAIIEAGERAVRPAVDDVDAARTTARAAGAAGAVGVAGAAGAPGASAASSTARSDAPALVLHRFAPLRAGRRVTAPFDLDVAAGEVVALTGPSGAGKSSVFAALLGFAAFEGAAFVGGAPAGAAARERSAWAGQRPTLLAGTVASNTTLGSDGAPRRLLAEALEAAGVELDAGHAVGADGAGLSGGQQQRVAIARALHRVRAAGVPVLLLDEPSSALDARNELRIAAAVRAVAASGVAVLVATHRPELVSAADRVLELEEVGHAVV